MKARIWRMKFGKILEIQKLKTNYRLFDNTWKSSEFTSEDYKLYINLANYNLSQSYVLYIRWKSRATMIT